MKIDLTLLHYTSNRLDDVNPRFAQIVRDQIVKSAGPFPIISISHRPMDFGENLCIGERPRSHLGIYKSILIGAKAAKTDYVACVEDDCLYHASSWTTHRPPLNRASYNLSRWGILTWSNPPVYGYRQRFVLNQMLAPRELVIEAFEERFAKFEGVPESEIPLRFWAEIGRYEKFLGVTPREAEGYASPVPSVVFSHEAAYGYESVGKRKSVGQFPRASLPHWGTAQQMVDLWKTGLSNPAAPNQSTTSYPLSALPVLPLRS